MYEIITIQNIANIHCCPGNAGTAIIATNHTVQASDVNGIVDLSLELGVDLVVVGPEAPLCDGLSERLLDNNIPCFGPIGALAQLEGSKLHAKHIMRQVGVPTADFQILDASSDIDSALSLYQDNPWVIKRDVLAGGKGVVVTTDTDEAKNFISKAIESDGKVLLEEFLPGEEASMLVVMDGSDFVCLPPSQDHKRAYDGDEGPNTGGMGAYCPAPVVTESVHDKVIDRIVKPMFDYLSGLEIPYRGVLYVGLMITDTGEPNVVEFNVRFGDPECQITIPMIKTDLFEVLDKTARDKLCHVDVKFHEAHALTVVLASEGYPNNPIKGRKIRGLDFSIPATNVGSSWVNFAGVGGGQETALASGGRVLSCSAMADTLNEAARLAYSLIDSIDLEGSFYRLDIGGKAL